MTLQRGSLTLAVLSMDTFHSFAATRTDMTLADPIDVCRVLVGVRGIGAHFVSFLLDLRQVHPLRKAFSARAFWTGSCA